MLLTKHCVVIYGIIELHKNICIRIVDNTPYYTMISQYSICRSTENLPNHFLTNSMIVQYLPENPHPLELEGGQKILGIFEAQNIS